MNSSNSFFSCSSSHLINYSLLSMAGGPTQTDGTDSLNHAPYQEQDPNSSIPQLLHTLRPSPGANSLGLPLTLHRKDILSS